ncbi:hypothetical protein E2K98_14115 [Bacillus salipaludis]|uniref:Uncharacterized protein n=1 Tax=Bacillus salipaludis TaxID=2547811 RepID=A0A4R5VR36_9BACI|nr:hypothetical protein [Bacillus salipaludis]MDQ6598595.1 hypothetical protein [Bacillus salipaludis]TDK60856.1 hypothetical protein E2K98_14115 [Bacillus salipaludis]
MASPQDDFRTAAAAMEQALADALNAAVKVQNPDTGFIERLLKLIIKKEIVLELLLEEFNNAG